MLTGHRHGGNNATVSVQLICASRNAGELLVMARAQHALDGKRGALPDIRPCNNNSISFLLNPPGTPRGQQVLVRCDADGEVWISIQQACSPN